MDATGVGPGGTVLPPLPLEETICKGVSERCGRESGEREKEKRREERDKEEREKEERIEREE
jgi:hypothetical protein